MSKYRFNIQSITLDDKTYVITFGPAGKIMDASVHFERSDGLGGMQDVSRRLAPEGAVARRAARAIRAKEKAAKGA